MCEVIDQMLNEVENTNSHRGQIKKILNQEKSQIEKLPEDYPNKKERIQKIIKYAKDKIRYYNAEEFITRKGKLLRNIDKRINVIYKRVAEEIYALEELIKKLKNTTNPGDLKRLKPEIKKLQEKTYFKSGFNEIVNKFWLNQ